MLNLGRKGKEKGGRKEIKEIEEEEGEGREGGRTSYTTKGPYCNDCGYVRCAQKPDKDDVPPAPLYFFLSSQSI